MAWCYMNDYILIGIFDYLHHSELCLKVALVCRHWYDVAQGMYKLNPEMFMISRYLVWMS